MPTWRERVQSLKRETLALYLAGRHRDTPWYAKVVVGCVAAYALSPIDLIPDFIPLLGYLDDALLLPLGFALARQMVPHAVMEECRLRASEMLSGGLPVSRVAAAVIISVWMGGSSDGRLPHAPGERGRGPRCSEEQRSPSPASRQSTRRLPAERSDDLHNAQLSSPDRPHRSPRRRPPRRPHHHLRPCHRPAGCTDRDRRSQHPCRCRRLPNSRRGAASHNLAPPPY